MSLAGAGTASRVLVVGADTDVSIAIHLHLDRAGHAVYCLPGPADMESIIRVVVPQVIVLLMPATPDGSWGSALTTAQSSAKLGMRVVMVAPSREVVEPLAAVAGAERALARSEVLARPLIVVERVKPRTASEGSAPPLAIAYPKPGPQSGRPTLGTQASGVSAAPSALGPENATTEPISPRRSSSLPSVDLMALIDEELVDEPRQRPLTTRVEVNVSLVSEHNFYVGPSRRIDTGGVFIATAMPPPVGTALKVRLGLADGRKVDLEGEVAFVREKSATTGRQPIGCGVKLRSLPGWAIDAIDRFILARQPIVYGP